VKAMPRPWKEASTCPIGDALTMEPSTILEIF